MSILGLICVVLALVATLFIVLCIFQRRDLRAISELSLNIQRAIAGERLHVELCLILVFDFDALRQPLAADGALNRERQLGDRPQIAPLEYEQHEEQRRHECEQHTDQPKNRHPET